jgi:CRISPR-associated endonuclease/helicase Cas3
MSDETGFLQQSSKRAFLGSVSVATIDQILMGVLGVRHQFIRSFGTRKSVLILDEIHSFDPYMMGLIDQVLKGQHQTYASAGLLSATLPDHIKNSLLSCYHGKLDCDSYPLISHTDLQGNTRKFVLPEAFQHSPKKEVVTEFWPGEGCLPSNKQLHGIQEWVQQGAMVAVICNTVADAQTVFLRIKEMAPDIAVDLFHARYAFADRAAIENDVLSKYGKKSKRQGRLLIATQVVEQSLDLDFDIMISQIAPIEYLFQRMGRLWRHERGGTGLYSRSHAVKHPLFITLIPEHEISKASNVDSVKKHYAGSGYVYRNIRWLYRTQQYLERGSSVSFPECYRLAIQYVHQVEPNISEPASLTEIAESYDIKGQGSYYAARQISAMQSRPLNDVDSRCALLTREGEMSASVVLFNKQGELLHGGDYDEQQDREMSLIPLAPKHAKGKKCDKYFCHKAIVGKDIQYNELGFIPDDLANELSTGR